MPCCSGGGSRGIKIERYVPKLCSECILISRTKRNLRFQRNPDPRLCDGCGCTLFQNGKEDA